MSNQNLIRGLGFQVELPGNDDDSPSHINRI